MYPSIHQCLALWLDSCCFNILTFLLSKTIYPPRFTPFSQTTLYPLTYHGHLFVIVSTCPLGFLGDSLVRNPRARAGDVGSIPGSGRSPREGNGNLGQDSCLGNPTDRGACWDTVHGVAKESIYPLNSNTPPHS